MLKSRRLQNCGLINHPRPPPKKKKDFLNGGYEATLFPQYSVYGQSHTDHTVTFTTRLGPAKNQNHPAALLCCGTKSSFLSSPSGSSSSSSEGMGCEGTKWPRPIPKRGTSKWKCRGVSTHHRADISVYTSSVSIASVDVNFGAEDC